MVSQLCIPTQERGNDRHFGVKKMAEKATLQRTGLYKSFNEKAKNTQYATVSKMLKAMNLRIKIETINS